MEEVQKLVYDIRLEITEYKVLMKDKRYETAMSVVMRIYQLADVMLELAKIRSEK